MTEYLKQLSFVLFYLNSTYSIFIHAGQDGIVIVDTTESCDVARYLFSQFQEKFSKKPLKAIILTHFHIGLF